MIDCLECSFPSTVGTDGLCEFCARFKAGEFRMVEDATIAFNLVTAIVERAVKDTRRMAITTETPAYCECGTRNRFCAAEYLRQLRSLTIDEDHDMQSVAIHVLDIAAGSRDMERIDPEIVRRLEREERRDRGREAINAALDWMRARAEGRLDEGAA